MYESDPDIIWWNGRLVPWDQARVHVTSEVATRGTNVFEGVRAYWQADAGHSALVHLRRHFARLAQSARLVRFPLDQVEAHIAQMRDGIDELVRAMGSERDLYLRPTLYIERGRYGWQSENTEVGSYIAGYPTDERSDRPLSCIVSSWRRTKDLAISPLAKAGAAYQAFRLPRIEAAMAGADEAILLNDADTVAETGGAAVFVVRDGVVATPSLADGVLDGITRKVVIELLRDRLDIPVVERAIPRTELYIADEAFLCGTLDEVRAIGSIDEVGLGSAPGPVTAAVRSRYLDACCGRVATSDSELLVPVEAMARAAE
jgi:branched-chain amino acid aminotransferase